MITDKRKIAINTLAIYTRMAVLTIATLVTTRYALLALGQKDFGLYNVVGAIIVMFNTFGTAMHTTTRRFINIEMGKSNGNLNKIFNVSKIIHISIAIVFFIIGESIGMWYINHYLNVAPERFSDACYVFHISVIVACIGLINIPYQGLMDAYQKFWQTAGIDIFNNILKILIAASLFLIEGDRLRYYALAMSITTITQFLLIRFACYKQWRGVVKNHWYGDKGIYKEIVVFNNYITLGATASLARTQGSTMLINYFFGTLMNAAYAIAFQIQGFVSMFANNIGTASAPQITQNYANGNDIKAIDLSCNMNRYTILLMTCIFFPLYSSMDAILQIWLEDVPKYASILCRWTLIYALIASFSSSVTTLIQATGRIKWFQIIGSSTELIVIILSFILFKNGFPAQTLLILLCIFTFIYRFLSLWLMRIIINFDSLEFVKKSYLSPLIIITIMTIFYYINIHMSMNGFFCQLCRGLIFFIITVILSFYIGLNKNEQSKIIEIMRNKLRR